jgi:hypothetical protein
VKNEPLLARGLLPRDIQHDHPQNQLHSEVGGSETLIESRYLLTVIEPIKALVLGALPGLLTFAERSGVVKAEHFTRSERALEDFEFVNVSLEKT